MIDKYFHKGVNMDEVKVIEVKKSIEADNNALASQIRNKLSEEKTLLLNLMSSPGSGKTTTLVSTLTKLKDKWKIAVVEADVDSTVDAKTILEAGIDAIQLHTGGMCHMDAVMTQQALDELAGEKQDLIILENIGNLICTAGFDVGAHLNINILSVPEGDDKPLKYPKMFEKTNLVLVNKIDAMEFFDFDKSKFEENVYMRNPKARIIYISAKTGENIDEFVKWLEDELVKHTSGA